MTVEIKPVASRRELSAFIRLPWQLYREEPNWVPPLLMDVKKRLDRKNNPFFEHTEAEYFLAWRDGHLRNSGSEQGRRVGLCLLSASDWCWGPQEHKDIAEILGIEDVSGGLLSVGGGVQSDR